MSFVSFVVICRVSMIDRSVYRLFAYLPYMTDVIRQASHVYRSTRRELSIYHTSRVRAWQVHAVGGLIIRAQHGGGARHRWTGDVAHSVMSASCSSLFPMHSVALYMATE